MQIEEGKFYRTHEGIKVGPMRRHDADSWYNSTEEVLGFRLWRDNGERFFGDNEQVIIEEWKDKMTDFDPNWPHGHVTRDGRKARIICTDRKSKAYSIIALVQIANKDNEEAVVSYTCEGKYRADGTDNRTDLTNAPAPKKECWVNLFYYEDNPDRIMSCIFNSREAADRRASADSFVRIACMHVTEGDGL